MVCVASHIGPVCVGAFGYSDDVALVAPSLYNLFMCTVKICEEFAKSTRLYLIRPSQNCSVSMLTMIILHILH